MKTSIHPDYHQSALVTCACGNQFQTGSTLSEIKVEICSACHPFFTGEMKFVDTQGRVERFEAMRQKAAKLQSKVKSKKAAEVKTDDQPKTLKEMMQAVLKDTSPTKTDSPKAKQ